MQWEHTSRAEAGEKFWHSQVVLKTQPKRAVSGTGLGSARGAVTQAERQSTQGWMREQRNKSKHAGRSEAKDLWVARWNK